MRHTTIILLGISYVLGLKQRLYPFPIRTPYCHKLKENLKKSILIIGVVSSCLCTNPLISVAVDGDAPKMKFFGGEDTTCTGEKVYVERKDSVALEKLKLLLPKWETTMKKVEMSVQSKKKADAKNILATAMNTFKTDMRQLSRVVSEGDIVERNFMPDGMNVKFDYNTGQFSLKGIPKQAESFFDQINDLYFYGVQDKPEIALDSLNKANNLFIEWYKEVYIVLSSK
mmetsp:Transcript_7850/g.8006  ORF Transcript_7850/g.8006 Transcript_7850/m.8006 type:complete len:228 (+) Transcript_7850:98-781(+)